MRVGFLALLLVVAIACGDDDISVSGDSGFSIRDASSSDGCVPYFLAAADRDRDAGNLDGGSVDAGGRDAGPLALTCDMPGTLDSECADIEWTFAGGEHITLAGCCAPGDGTSTGSCGGVDPTGLAGCIGREIFGLQAATCLPDANLDAGHDDAGDDDAAVPAI